MGFSVLHAAVRARRDRRRDDVERISERRSLIRARGREKWRTALPGDGMTVEQVQEQFPALYQSQAGFPSARSYVNFHGC
jgi:hypothetical protein